MLGTQKACNSGHCLLRQSELDRRAIRCDAGLGHAQLDTLSMSEDRRPRLRFQERNLCAGCLSCQTTCSLRSVGLVGPESPRIRIEVGPFSGDNTARYCRQCEHPKCMESCTAGAIVRDDQTGIVSILSEICDACGVCVEACPFGAMFWDSASDRPFKCDLCGGDPACVKACNFEVLVYE
jgi:carbon-monoxide dehydrogenase iron sulfur subunit